MTVQQQGLSLQELTCHGYFSQQGRQIIGLQPLHGGFNHVAVKVDFSQPIGLPFDHSLNNTLNNTLNHTLNHTLNNTLNHQVVARRHDQSPRALRELKVQQQVAALGFAPPVVDRGQTSGIAIIQFWAGQHLLACHWPDRALDGFAQQLAMIHQLPNRYRLPRTRLDKAINGYLQQLPLTPSDKPLVAYYQQRFGQLQQLPQRWQLCHQDLVVGNVIIPDDVQGLSDGRDGRKPCPPVQLIDWEFCAINDGYFDLASFCVEHQLNDHQQQRLLNHYHRQGLHDQPNPLKLQLMMESYSFICWLWHKVQCQINNSDHPDQASYQRHLDSQARYQQWLVQALDLKNVR